MNMEDMREIIRLEEQAKAAAEALGKASLGLQKYDRDLKLSAWDWNKSGASASIMPQGRVVCEVVERSKRGQ